MKVAEPGHNYAIYFKLLLTWAMIKSVVPSVTTSMLPTLATALEPCKRIKVYTPFTRYIYILATHFWCQILDPAQLHWVTSHFDTSVKCAHLVEHGWLCFSSHLFTRKDPGACPYYNRQPLKILWIEQNHKNLTPPNFFYVVTPIYSSLTRSVQNSR